MCGIARLRDQLQQEDPMASLIPLENLFRACLLFTIACYGFLVIGFATWLFRRNVHERGQSSRRAVPQRDFVRRRGASSCAAARPSIDATDAAHREAEPLHRHRSAARRSTGSDIRLLAESGQITSKAPVVCRSWSAGTTDPERSRTRETSTLLLLGAAKPTASKTPRQRSAVNPEKAGGRRGVVSRNDPSTRRQLSSLSSSSRFYAEVVNKAARQAALQRLGSSETMAQELRPPLKQRSTSETYVRRRKLTFEVGSSVQSSSLSGGDARGSTARSQQVERRPNQVKALIE